MSLVEYKQLFYTEEDAKEYKRRIYENYPGPYGTHLVVYPPKSNFNESDHWLVRGNRYSSCD